jgi:WD40 repeat protein
MRIFQEAGYSSLGLPPDSYVYAFGTNHTSGQVSAVISSDDSLRFFDNTTLKPLPDGIFQSVNRGVTSLTTHFSSSRTPYLTAGRDGFVRGWDLRARGKVLELATPKGESLSALASNPDLHAVVAGMELDSIGPGDVSIFGWDVRFPEKIKLHYAESHTDTITELQFLPRDGRPSNFLLSGSTDGLVNIYDTSTAEEEDAVFQVINHRSAIHHAGLLGNDIYALGTDETLSFYSQQNPDLEAEDPHPVHLGDVREQFGCDYVANVVQVGFTPVVSAGRHMDDPHLDLIPLVKAPVPSPGWTAEVNHRIRLAGGHGPEIIRDVLWYADGEMAFTCGEDGVVRAWKERK